jgi:hypothetical protein
MARRLTLEGAKVLGVYEIKPEPSGLTRNIVQCLEDYNIPLHLSTTVTEVHGTERLEGVTVCRVDENMRPLPGSEEYVPCDTLVLSVGLIPENDILHPLGVEIDPRTGGPVVDQLLATSEAGLFSCGNALHVNDLVDYVSESGEIAGASAARHALGDYRPPRHVPILAKGEILYAVPQRLDVSLGGQGILYFRAARTLTDAALVISAGGRVLGEKKYKSLRPPEMERIVLDLSLVPAGEENIVLELRG